MTAADGTFDAVTEAVTAAVDRPLAASTCSTSAARTRAATGAPFSSVLVNGADAGARTTSPTLTPATPTAQPTSRCHATGDDTATGGSNIAGGGVLHRRPWAHGTGLAMTVNTASPVASLDAVDPRGHAGPLAEGTHTVSSTRRTRPATGEHS